MYSPSGAIGAGGTHRRHTLLPLRPAGYRNGPVITALQRPRGGQNKEVVMAQEKEGDIRAGETPMMDDLGDISGEGRHGRSMDVKHRCRSGMPLGGQSSNGYPPTNERVSPAAFLQAATSRK